MKNQHDSVTFDLVMNDDGVISVENLSQRFDAPVSIPQPSAPTPPLPLASNQRTQSATQQKHQENASAKSNIPARAAPVAAKPSGSSSKPPPQKSNKTSALLAKQSVSEATKALSKNSRASSKAADSVHSIRPIDIPPSIPSSSASDAFTNVHVDPETDHPTFWVPGTYQINYIPRRYILTALCFLAVAINYSDRQNISVAIIKMAADLKWTNSEKGVVLSAFYIGYFLSNIPSGFLADRIGGKRVMLIGASLWSLFTILTPAATSSYHGLLLLRVLLGATEGMCWPAVHAMMPAWFPKSEIGSAVALFTSGSYLGTVVTLISAPPLIVRYDWPSAFYVFGCLGFVFIVLWQWLVADTPTEHGGVHPKEIAFIEKFRSHHTPIASNVQAGGNSDSSSSSSAASSVNLATHRLSVKKNIPWKILLTTRQLWAFFANMFASGWGFFVLLAWMPDFFNEEYGVALSSIGYFTIWPFLFQGACAALSGVLSEQLIRRGVLTPFQSCTWMQMIGLAGPSIFLTLLGFVRVDPITASVFLTLALSLNAFTCAGVSAYHLLIVPQFAGLVFSIGNTFAILPGVIGIAAAGSIIDLYHSWTLVFLIGIISYLLGAVVWFVCSKGRPEALERWLQEQEQHESQQLMDAGVQLDAKDQVEAGSASELP